MKIKADVAKDYTVTLTNQWVQNIILEQSPF